MQLSEMYDWLDRWVEWEKKRRARQKRKNR